MTPPELVDHLRPAERVLWWGRAVPGGFFDSIDAAPAFLAGGAGSLLVAIGVGRASTGATGVGATVALVLLGLGVAGAAVARVVTGQRHRRESVYAITDQRLLFLLSQRRGGPRLHTLPLAEPAYPALRVNASGSGTISFKADLPGLRGELRRSEHWAFEGIADVRAVFDVYERAVDARRRAVSAAASPDGPRRAG